MMDLQSAVGCEERPSEAREWKAGNEEDTNSTSIILLGGASHAAGIAISALGWFHRASRSVQEHVANGIAARKKDLLRFGSGTPASLRL